MSQLVDRSIRREQELSMEPFLRASATGKWEGEDKPMPTPLVQPWRIGQLQPASYDVRLGRELRTENGMVLDLDEEWTGGKFRMAPGRFLLGHTEEYFRIPPHLCARVDGKSTIGRRGLAVHVTAGFIDPGFNGQITLELKNHSQVNDFMLEPGLLIAQVTFHRLTDVPERPYGHPNLGSHYQGQTGATAAVVEPG